ncbi:hypothetical protein Tco_0924911 [Tanacetum coccineum]|uniref:Uncharacterized protein n=1 Tax=Tanacetum coccineum TaxID=301880 RepID=A0ABQ5D6Q2_9ASTR
MGSGEGYGIAVECTRDSGLELETVGKAGMVLAGRGLSLHRFTIGFRPLKMGKALLSIVFFSSGYGLTADSFFIDSGLWHLDFGL